MNNNNHIPTLQAPTKLFGTKGVCLLQSFSTASFVEIKLFVTTSLFPSSEQIVFFVFENQMREVNYNLWGNLKGEVKVIATN